MLCFLYLSAFGRWASCITTALPGGALSATESSVLPSMTAGEEITETSANFLELYNSSANGLSSGVSRGQSPNQCKVGHVSLMCNLIAHRPKCEIAWAVSCTLSSPEKFGVSREGTEIRGRIMVLRIQLSNPRPLYSDIRLRRVVSWREDVYQGIMAERTAAENSFAYTVSHDTASLLWSPIY